MSFARLELTGATVFALCDAVGPYFRPRAEAFPDAPAPLWAAADRLDPAAVDPDGQWVLHFHCYAIRFDAGPTVLVDAGIGPADALDGPWAPLPGRLPDQLAEAGVDPAAVEVVVLTHLHTDHLGWAAADLFPTARHVLQRADADAARPAVAEALLDPLRTADRLQVVDGDVRLLPGLSLRHTPGHTPGHQVALLRAGDETLAVTGDLLLHALHLLDPTQPYLFDADPDAARRSRLALLDELAGGRGTLATSHPTEPFHPVPAPS